MELNDFVAETLKDIIEGVRTAQSEGLERNVNPQGMQLQADGAPKGKHYQAYGNRLVLMVQFDVAVTVSSEKKGEGGGKISVLGQKAGLEGSVSQEKTEVSRIKFEVPVVMPQGEEVCQ